MIKIVMSKEGVKKILNSHDVKEVRKIYALCIFQSYDVNRFEGEFRSLVTLTLGEIERLLNEDRVMFIKIDTSDEKNLTTMEADNEL